MENLLNKLDPYATLIGRILLSLIFIATGAGKLAGDPAATIGYMESVGVPGFLFYPSTPFELLGGIAILIGYRTRIVAFLMAGFCIIAAALFHSNFADQIQMYLFMKNISMAGGFLILMRFGAGEFSIDNRAPENAD
ncbi:MAG: DoxX family protein [Kordiimonadaceae bacterium]|nr:DoxX family protein [Kordiimonadaceae bacterium]